MNSMPDKLWAHGDAATRELNRWFVKKVLISDDTASALRMTGNTFARYERYVLYYGLLLQVVLPSPSPSERQAKRR